MTLFNSTSDLLPGLSQGAFRGVKFEIVDAEHETGRRIVTHFFPGVDPQAREDQGRLDGPIKVMGLIVGEDYVERARQLEAALGQPGPGTLVHPWLGELRVVVPAGARIRFSTGELRVARFDIVFEREVEQLATGQASASRLSGSLGKVRSGAAGLLGSALASRLAPVNALDVAFTLGNQLMTSALSEALQLQNGAALAESVSGLLRSVASNPTQSQIVEAVSALSSLVGKAAKSRPRPAIAIGRNVLAEEPVPTSAASTARLALKIAQEADEVFPLGLPDKAAKAAWHAGLVSAAIEAAALIDFEAREEAFDWRKDLDEALAKSSSLASSLTESLPGPAAILTSLLRETRSALFTDFNEIIGQLPRTVMIRGGLPALMIAYDLKGNSPAEVAKFANDIVRRNKLANPAVTPRDGVEVLQ